MEDVISGPEDVPLDLCDTSVVPTQPMVPWVEALSHWRFFYFLLSL